MADKATDSSKKYDEPGRRGSAANFFFSTLIEGPPILPPPDDGPPTDPEGNSQPPPESPEGTARLPSNNGATDVWLPPNDGPPANPKGYSWTLPEAGDNRLPTNHPIHNAHLEGGDAWPQPPPDHPERNYVCPLPNNCPPANPEGYSRTLPEARDNRPLTNHPGHNAHLEGGDTRPQPANLKGDAWPPPDHPERNYVWPPPDDGLPANPKGGYSWMLPEAGDNRPQTNHPGCNAHLEGGGARPQPANLKGDAWLPPDHPERNHVWPLHDNGLPANPEGYSWRLPEAGDNRPPTNRPGRNAHLEGGDAQPQPANLEGNARPPPNDEPSDHPKHNARPQTKSGFKGKRATAKLGQYPKCARDRKLMSTPTSHVPMVTNNMETNVLQWNHSTLSGRKVTIMLLICRLGIVTRSCPEAQKQNKNTSSHNKSLLKRISKSKESNDKLRTCLKGTRQEMCITKSILFKTQHEITATINVSSMMEKQHLPESQRRRRKLKKHRKEPRESNRKNCQPQR